ncbi:DUF1294 domain-containing protein [Tepidimicrobium xylanilyticum]|uniref:Uncharacterized membrane protein YsdA, DUF1294 family n=1 Tax=Tepidimicrobium xylanilyticum TaxID=1123352 RepID=A0A1H2X7W5_9FIRM|nr:DUF1294 domain-containing protein [Tepidimicrobium xylanilyticum]GMG97411.1 hypothetical protein EN5CB1_22370 [Tepidimicrobium xylanilyticum]SDW88349.1 Uncharacterized membrane protein YsdA, DUF1294 family [Tepidimicrobium xylanilyticum]
MKILSNFNNKEVALLTYIFIINLIAFVVMGLDKIRARKDGWRIREITIMILALLGGATGVLSGMVIFKHKINKNRFSVGIPLILLLNKLLNLIMFNYLR